MPGYGSPVVKYEVTLHGQLREGHASAVEEFLAREQGLARSQDGSSGYCRRRYYRARCCR